jgi:hypothetical protein
MAAPTVVSPTILVDPGWLFWAPLATAVPTHTVAGSVFTDTWSAPWVWLGATAEGSTLTTSMSVEYVRAAEIFNPVGSSITEQNSSISFALMSYTLNNLKRILNGGTIATVSGTGATTLSKFSPPTSSQIVRSMIGWESTDGTTRAVLYQCLNTADVEQQFKKAPDAATLPATFSCEVPSGSSFPYEMWSAGTARVGT